ncbi:hypothetical protein FOZ61_003099 [Perkinsus olseni]|uniref:Tetratricopeptide repeat protein n=1 Tax=Perkinsus olseni TaxID=32597 RepID=A0A7J6LR33_PEROL|nr:hypothetical protein FOZ61_003099 [Perkinsus olseni]
MADPSPVVRDRRPGLGEELQDATSVMIGPFHHGLADGPLVLRYGTVLHSKGDLEGAREIYEASLGIFDDNAVTDYSVAQIHLERGELWQAHTRMVKISNGHGIGFDDTSRFAFLVDAGYTLAALGDCAAGMPLLREGLGIVRRVPHALNALAICLVWQDGRFDEGVRTLMEAIQYDTNHPVLWSNAAALSVWQGDLDGAVYSISLAESCFSRLLEAGGHHENSTHYAAFLHNLNLVRGWQDGKMRTEDPRLEYFFTRIT